MGVHGRVGALRGSACASAVTGVWARVVWARVSVICVWTRVGSARARELAPSSRRHIPVWGALRTHVGVCLWANVEQHAATSNPPTSCAHLDSLSRSFDGSSDRHTDHRMVCALAWGCAHSPITGICGDAPQASAGCVGAAGAGAQRISMRHRLRRVRTGRPSHGPFRELVWPDVAGAHACALFGLCVYAGART